MHVCTFVCSYVCEAMRMFVFTIVCGAVEAEYLKLIPCDAATDYKSKCFAF